MVGQPYIYKCEGATTTNPRGCCGKVVKRPSGGWLCTYHDFLDWKRTGKPLGVRNG